MVTICGRRAAILENSGKGINSVYNNVGIPVSKSVNDFKQGGLRNLINVCTITILLNSWWQRFNRRAPNVRNTHIAHNVDEGESLCCLWRRNGNNP